MTDDRFGQIEDKLNTLISGQKAVQADVEELTTGLKAVQADVGELKTGQSALKADVKELKTGQSALKADVGELKSSLSALKADVGELKGSVEKRLDKLEVGQESMSDKIKQIAEGHGATQAAIERAAKTVCKHIDRRIKPLEDVVRERLGAR